MGSLRDSEKGRIQSVYSTRDWDSQYSWTLPSHRFWAQGRERYFLDMLTRHTLLPLSGRRILEIGCGRGNVLREFIKWGAEPMNVSGVDLLPESVEYARRLCPRGVQVDVGNAGALSYAEESFDIVIQATAFSSVLDSSLRQEMASEMLRVLKPCGAILWYDLRWNNPWNHNVSGLNRHAIAHLFPNCRIWLVAASLAPPITRKLIGFSWGLCSVLERCRLLNSHYVGVVRREESAVSRQCI